MIQGVGTLEFSKSISVKTLFDQEVLGNFENELRSFQLFLGEW